MQLRDGCEPFSSSTCKELKAGECARSTSAAAKTNRCVMLPPFGVGVIPLASRFRLPPEVGVPKPSELFLLQLCPLSMSEGEYEGVAAAVPFRGVSLLVGGGVAGTSGGVDGSLVDMDGERAELLVQQAATCTAPLVGLIFPFEQPCVNRNEARPLCDSLDSTHTQCMQFPSFATASSLLVANGRTGLC